MTLEGARVEQPQQMPTDRMPKLLIVSTVAITLRSFLLPYARHFRSMGWQVDGAAHGAAEDPECLDAFDSAFNIAWSRKRGSLGNLFRAPGQIQSIVKRNNYDLVHVHTPIASLLSRYVLRNLRRSGRPKIIYTVHGFTFHPEGSKIANLMHLTLEKIAGHWTDYLIAINQSDSVAAQKHRILPPERIKYMPGIGVDTRVYSPDSVTNEEVQALREEIGLAPDDKFFLMIGEFIPRKRHADALQALALTRNLRIHVGFAGVGGLEKEMENLAGDLGLLRGFTSWDIAKIYLLLSEHLRRLYSYQIARACQGVR